MASLENKIKIKVSVIVPIYNVQSYILECLDSLSKQTLSDLEVILVDDHGSDNSMTIAKEWIASNNLSNRFILTETPTNSGPGIARNIGIQIARGKYIAYLDSDDLASPSMYEDLYIAAEQQQADICSCSMKFIDKTGQPLKIVSNPMPANGEFSKIQKKDFLVNFVTFGCTYIYKKSFLTENQISFLKERSSEDTYFLTCVILCAQSGTSVNKPLHLYRQLGNSLSKKTDSKRYLDKLSALKKVISFAKDHNLYEPYKEEIAFVYLKKAYLTGYIDYIQNTIKPNPQTLRQINQDLKNTFPNIEKNKYLKKNLKVRALVWIFQRLPFVSKFIVNKILTQ